MGIDSSEKGNQIGLEERIELVSKLYKQALKRSELRDEIFAQISKQTRNCPDRYHRASLIMLSHILLNIYW